MNDNTYPTLELPHGRGCGSRDPEAPYLCTGIGEVGHPPEYFVYDPAIPWTDVLQRGYTLVKDKEGINHVFMFVSKNDYPHPWDFVTECRYGVSRKVDTGFPFDKLSPEKSTMQFVHARAIPGFIYMMLGPLPEKDREHCRLHYCKWAADGMMQNHGVHDTQDLENHEWDWSASGTPTGYHPYPPLQSCAYAGRQLGYIAHQEQKYKGYEVETDEDAGMFTVNGPSFAYSGFLPEYDPDKVSWKAGVFYWSRITHVEYKDEPDKKSEADAQAAGYDTLTLNY